MFAKRDQPPFALIPRLPHYHNHQTTKVKERKPHRAKLGITPDRIPEQMQQTGYQSSIIPLRVDYAPVGRPLVAALPPVTWS